MMNKKRTRKIGRTKYLMFIPLAALLMIISNIEAVARTTKAVAKDVIEAVEENLASNVTVPDVEVATETVQTETPAPQQDKDQLVAYQGIVSSADGKPIKGVEILIDAGFKLPQDQSFLTDEKGHFSFRAFKDAHMVALWQKGDKVMAKRVIFEPDGLKNIKVVMDGEWQDAPVVDPENPVFEVVEQMPEFPNGGMAGLMEYLNKSIQYPANAQKNGTQGRVSVQFVVNKDGNISDVKVIRSVDEDLDKEALRVMSSMPKWKPGMQKGKPVRVRYTVPVIFRLSGDETSKENYKPVDNNLKETLVVGYERDEEEQVSEDQVFEVVEEMPSFPGGMQGLMQYLSKNIKYPLEAQKTKKQGRVVVQVIIDEKGNVVNPTVKRGVDPLLDAEAIRVVTSMPKWKPGAQRGVPVKVRYSIPIQFNLQK